MRVLAFAVFCSLLLAAGSAPVLAQSDYPNRPVRLIVGLGPGSAADVSARVIGGRVSAILGQQFVIEGRPGAGSNIAADYVARAEKDGYTLFLGTVANAINATLTPNLAFDFSKDFQPIAPMTAVPNILVVHPSLGVRSVAELIALAQKKPGEIFFGSSGIGTSPHLSGELFNVMAGTKLVHVPYQGSAQVLSDLLTGRVQLTFSPASTVLPHAAEGKLIALASTRLQRASAAPDLPTLSEAGLPGFDTSVWTGLLAPIGTPQSIVDRLNAAINEALRSPEVRAALHKQGIEPLGGTQDEFGQMIAAEIKKWAEVAAAAGLKKAQ